MWARSRVMPAAITRSAAPALNRFSAIFSIIWPVVRSLMPIATVRLPIGMMSPPSLLDAAERLALLLARVPELEARVPAKSGWKR